MPSAANVTLEQEIYSVNETDGAVMVCAMLTEGVLERNVTVYLSTSDGSAVCKHSVHAELQYGFEAV